MPKGYAEPVETRIWKSYDPEPNSGCWLWTLTISRDGYGLVATRGKTRQAHRVAYELAVGPIPDGLQIRHKCDVRSCINYSHMLVGTNAENMADRNGRGRQMRYERMWKSKLTQDGVREIRALRASGMTLRQLAQRYGVWRTTIESVLYGKTWKGISLWAK